MKQYDAIIIGFGKGGKTLAAELAKRKLDVAVVERSEKDVRRDMYQYRLHSHKNIGACGKACGQRRFLGGQEGILSSVHCKEGRGRLFPASEELSQSGRQSSYNGLYGYRLLCRSDVVEVGMVEGTLQLQAPRIFINTGAETVIPPIEGIQGNPRVYTSTSIMELTELPVQLVIVGGDTSD